MESTVASRVSESHGVPAKGRDAIHLSLPHCTRRTRTRARSTARALEHRENQPVGEGTEGLKSTKREEDADISDVRRCDAFVKKDAALEASGARRASCPLGCQCATPAPPRRSAMAHSRSISKGLDKFCSVDIPCGCRRASLIGGQR